MKYINIIKALILNTFSHTCSEMKVTKKIITYRKTFQKYDTNALLDQKKILISLNTKDELMFSPPKASYWLLAFFSIAGSLITGMILMLPGCMKYILDLKLNYPSIKHDTFKKITNLLLEGTKGYIIFSTLILFLFLFVIVIVLTFLRRAGRSMRNARKADGAKTCECC